MENNENNVQNQEKKQSKGLSVGLVIIMLIAVLIIGIGGGYLLSKNDSLFNKNETKSNSNNSNNLSAENNVTNQNKATELVKDSEKETSRTEPIETATYDDFKVLGIDGNFYKLKDLAIVQREVNTNTENRLDIKCDINKDGTDENITFEIRTDTSTGTPQKYVNIWVTGADIAQILYANELNMIYFVDCDASDKYIDLITTQVEGSDWRKYTLFRFDGEDYKEITTMHCYQDNLYINQNGILTTKALNFTTSDPIIASEYYDYKSQKSVKIDLTKYSNLKINFKNVYFSKDVEKEQDVFNMWENGKTFEEALKENNVVSYDSIEAYLLEIEETHSGTKYKVRLLDGSEGYFLGPWAG